MHGAEGAGAFFIGPRTMAGVIAFVAFTLAEQFQFVA